MHLPRSLGTTLLLLPALVVVVGLFGAGLLLGLLQSLGLLPLVGTEQPGLTAYAQLFGDPAVLPGLLFSLRIALLATLLSALFGLSIPLLLRATPWGRAALAVLFQLNLPVPHVVGAVAMLLLLAQSGVFSRILFAWGLTDGISAFPPLVQDRFGTGIVLAYVWKETPFIGLTVLAALSSGVAELEDAARALGAGPLQRLRHVTLPLLAPPLLGTSALVMAFTFGAYEVPALLGQSFPEALPVLAYRVYYDADLTRRPFALAISLLVAALSAGLALAGLWAGRRLLGRAW